MTSKMASEGMSMGRFDKIYPGSAIDFIRNQFQGVEPTTEPPIGPPGGLKCHKCTKGYLAFVPPELVNASKKQLENIRINIEKMEQGLRPPEWVTRSCHD